MRFPFTLLWTSLLVACAACGDVTYEARINGTTLRYTASWDGFHIAYTVERDGIADLFVTDETGSGCTRIDTHIAGPIAWSPDGTRLAYRTKDPASAQVSLQTLRVDGSDRRLVTGGWRHVGQPLWSPDGLHLAFTTAGFSGRVALRVSRVDGGDPVEIDSDSVFMDISWSPDGTRLAYRAGASVFDAFELRCAFADGSGRAVVSGAGDVRAGAVLWCQDGTRLLYRADEELPGVLALYSVRPDGSDRRRLSGDLDAGCEVLGGFACSPDGGYAAFGTARHGDGTTELFVTSWDGVPYRVIEGLARFLDVPVFDWSPDGQWLALRTALGQLLTFDPSTQTLVGIAIDVEPDFRWSPDGRHLAYRSGGWLHVAAADGASVLQIARSAPGFVWSPDADAVLFVDGRLYRGAIRDGSVSLVSDLAVVGEPLWLRTGDRIVFAARDHGGDVSLYLAWPHGGAVRVACADSREDPAP